MGNENFIVILQLVQGCAWRGYVNTEISSYSQVMCSLRAMLEQRQSRGEWW